MVQCTILDLNQFCYFALFKEIRQNCEKTNENSALDDLKYMELNNFLSSYPPFRLLFYDWDWELSKKLFLLDVSSVGAICIDFAELYERLRGLPEKVKKPYWKSLYLAIEQNDVLTSVELKYHPKTYHREHMDVFESVMKQLRAKKGLKKLKVQIAGYTLTGLNGFDSLEELHLDVKVDIEELTECCRKNQEISFLMVGDQQSGGRRLADIVPFCCQVRRFGFRMKFDCNASEYAPLAKLPKLEKLQIWGEHERGTLQALFRGLARREARMFLSTLYVDDASLVSAETKELSQIESLTKLRYRCAGPQDIGPLAQLTNLRSLDILSHHDFKLIGDQIFRILEYSQRRRKVFLPGCWITYNPTEDALLLVLLQDHDASDYGSLLRLPNLSSLEINGHHKAGTLVGLFDELAQVEVSTLTIGIMNAFAIRDFTKRVGKLSYPDYPLINPQEIVALARCKSLKRLLCGISDTRNIELLAELSELRDLTITTKPSSGSLVRLFKDMAASNCPCLRDFKLSNGRINIQEASALAQIGSLRSLEFEFYDATDIEIFSSPGWPNLKILSLVSDIKLHEISDVTLRVSQFCGKFINIYMKDVTMAINREQKHLQLTMYPTEIYSSKTMLHSLANLYWVESLCIDVKPFNLSRYFKAISTSDNCQLKKISIEESFLEPNETEELSKIKSLKGFRGKLANTRSLEHLSHLSYLNIGDSFKNRSPKQIVPILDSIKTELTISVHGNEVSYNIKTGHLFLRSTSSNVFPNSSNDASDFAPLATLKILQSVRICGSHMESSLYLFLSQLASRKCQTLQELAVESEEMDSDLNKVTVSSSMLEEIGSIKSLRKLKCGFSEVQNLELIAGLPHLTELVITTHQKGSLKDLFRRINSMESLRLEYLAVKGDPINREEAEEIRKIKPLQRLIYRFDQDPSVISDLLRLSPELKTLVITSREHSLAHFENTATEDTIARLPQDIKQDLLSFDGFGGVVQYLDRQRLVIELPPEMNCLKFLFEALALNESQSLQQLVIRHRYIGLEEAASIAHISSLKRLMFGLQDSSGLSHLCSLKRLESLEIRSLENFAELSQDLICLLQSCKGLESIDLDFSFPIQYIRGGFLLRAVSTLQSVRNPSSKTPLKLRFPPNKRIFKDPMSSIDEEYLKVEGAREPH